MPPLSEIASMVAGQIFTTVPVPDADFSGKTIIVTGANNGLGLEACKHLVRLNASHLLLACRDLTKAATAKDEILASNPGSTTRISLHPLDLTSFSSVTAFASHCTTTLPRLDALIANAGIEVKHFSLAEGYEQTLTVNVLSTFLLGLLLLPKLQKTGEEYATETYFSVVGSAIQIFAPHKQLQQENPFAALSDESKADMPNRYYLSKAMETLCVQALAARTTSHLNKVIINCVSPGFCDTGLYSRFQPPLYTRVLLRVIGSTAEEGSRCLVWGILKGRESHGGFMSEGVVKGCGKWMGSAEGWQVRERVWGEVVGVLEGRGMGVEDVLRA